MKNIKKYLEKVRAILTRRGTKARDFVDVFVITEKLDKDMWAFKKDVILKAKFMLKYEKYQQNLAEKSKIKTWIKPGFFKKYRDFRAKNRRCKN